MTHRPTPTKNRISCSIARQLVRALFCGSLIMASLSCAADRNKKAIKAQFRDPNTVRYRLLLRDNHVDKGEAFRCYGACQTQATPRAYVDCLTECPGFERDPGFMCAEYEVPPVAACLTVRKVKAQNELDPSLVILGKIGETALVIGLSSVCASMSSPQCETTGYGVNW